MFKLECVINIPQSIYINLCHTFWTKSQNTPFDNNILVYIKMKHIKCQITILAEDEHLYCRIYIGGLKGVWNK